MRRLLKTVVLGALAYGGYVYVKQLLDEEDAPPAPPAKPAAAPTSPSQSSSNGSAGSPSKADLYERAQALDIKGRSKMSKSELERAVREAG